MRAQIAIGNWKMHKTLDEAVFLAASLVQGLPELPAGVVVGVAPAFPLLRAVGAIVAPLGIELIAQDCHWEPKGAFTSAVSVPMLASLGVQRVIVGHSERRKHFGDDDAIVAKKTRAVLEGGLQAVVCVGETLEERDANQQVEVVSRQVKAALSGLSREQLTHITLAYEPVWAIGTGRTASPEQAGEMHACVRALLADFDGGDAVSVLYGGSVKPTNVKDLTQTPAVDGVLVGGASLEANSFAQIARGCVGQNADAGSA